MEQPAGCDGADFRQTWQTSPFFQNEAQTEVFDYNFMKNDTNRTPLYYAAIRKRISEAKEPLVILDLGTGAQALLALEAARAGAKKVYAIEAQASQAALAREAVAGAGFAEIVEIVEGLSTEVTLPEKVDLLVSETVGSVASEEGLYATIADAHARHVKRPTRRDSWIPHRCHTVGAPCSYALHFALGPPDHNWRRTYRGVGLPGPPRIAAHEPSLQLLAAPQTVETIDFTDPQLPMVGTHALTAGPLHFELDSERMRQNEAALFRAALPQEGDEGYPEEEEATADEIEQEALRAEAATFALLASRSLSGVALWPRLELDPDATIVVEARGEGGETRRSSWSCLVPLIGDRPLSVSAGDTVTMEMDIRLERDVEQPPAYTIRGHWSRQGGGDA